MRKEKQQVIYSITNEINGKKYIGSAKDFVYRQKSHIRLLRKGKHHSRKLQNSWNKYGEENFKFEILEHIEDLNKLIENEQKWMDFFKPELNVALIAGINSGLGIKRTEETRKKISDALKGKKLSEETRKKISETLKGRKLSEEHKKNISRGNKNSEKYRKALENPERIEKIKETRIKNGGYIVSDNMREKISKTLKEQNLQSAVSIEVSQYNLEGELLNTFPSLAKAEKANGIKSGRLSWYLINSKKNSYKGYIFKKYENN